ncbi:hypothetical protein ACTHGU_10305 [Chitinophagaceae bacterium MMS25-I14]
MWGNTIAVFIALQQKAPAINAGGDRIKANSYIHGLFNVCEFNDIQFRFLILKLLPVLTTFTNAVSSQEAITGIDTYVLRGIYSMLFPKLFACLLQLLRKHSYHESGNLKQHAFLQIKNMRIPKQHIVQLIPASFAGINVPRKGIAA